LITPDEDFVVLVDPDEEGAYKNSHRRRAWTYKT